MALFLRVMEVAWWGWGSAFEWTTKKYGPACPVAFHRLRQQANYRPARGYKTVLSLESSRHKKACYLEVQDNTCLKR